MRFNIKKIIEKFFFSFLFALWISDISNAMEVSEPDSISFSCYYTEDPLSKHSKKRTIIDDFDDFDDKENDSNYPLTPIKKKKIPLDVNINEKLTSYNLDNTGILSLKILNQSLFKDLRKQEEGHKKPVHTRNAIKLDAISPNKAKEFRESGGNSEALEGQVYELKQVFPSPIRDPNLSSDTDIFTPPSRKVMSRPTLKRARKDGVVQSLFPAAFQEPVKEETLEEKEERKKIQAEEFKKAQELRGIKSEDLEAGLEKELDIWQPYFNYIKMRKSEITGKQIDEINDEEVEGEEDDEGEDENPTLIGEKVTKESPHTLKKKKIRRGEIEDIFKEHVAPKLTYYEIDGYHVYFSKETLDFDMARKEKDNPTNLTAMEEGKCPIGHDGKPMNYHHLTHYDYLTHKVNSVIVLLTETLHQTYSGCLHYGRNTYQDLPRKKVNRLMFNNVRMKFSQFVAKKYTKD